MNKKECDRCKKIYEPSESKTVEFPGYPCEIDLCSKCWDEFLVWAKLN